MIKVIHRKKIKINKLTEIPKDWTIKEIIPNGLKTSTLWIHFGENITGKKYEAIIEKEIGTIN